MSAIAGQQHREQSARSTARMAGVFYLLNILTIFLAIFFFRGLFVSGDLVATATNLAAHSTLFGLGFASELISTSCSLCVAALLYELFKPVDRSLSLLAAFFRVIACAVAAMGYVFQVAPFQFGRHAPSFAALKLDAVQALSALVSTLHAYALNILLVFFGFHFILLGYLILRSPAVPRVLGLIVIAAGFGALIFLAPPIGASLFPYFAGLGLIAELSLTTWLLLGSGRPA
jgi:hypothetical protein